MDRPRFIAMINASFAIETFLEGAHRQATFDRKDAQGRDPALPPIYRRFGLVETGIEEFIPPRPLTDGQPCHYVVMSKPL